MARTTNVKCIELSWNIVLIVKSIFHPKEMRVFGNMEIVKHRRIRVMKTCAIFESMVAKPGNAMPIIINVPCQKLPCFA